MDRDGCYIVVSLLRQLVLLLSHMVLDGLMPKSYTFATVANACASLTESLIRMIKKKSPWICYQS